MGRLSRRKGGEVPTDLSPLIARIERRDICSPAIPSIFCKHNRIDTHTRPPRGAYGKSAVIARLFARTADSYRDKSRPNDRSRRTHPPLLTPSPFPPFPVFTRGDDLANNFIIIRVVENLASAFNSIIRRTRDARDCSANCYIYSTCILTHSTESISAMFSHDSTRQFAATESFPLCPPLSLVLNGNDDRFYF